jgi:hypothetical protein
MLQEANGLRVTNDIVCPGVLSFAEYKNRRKHWDIVRQCVGLDAQFYAGAQLLLFPPDWLNYSEELHRGLSGRRRVAKAMGVDTGQGVANSSWAVVDALGLIELVSYKTPNTSVIPGQTKALMRKYNLEPEQVLFDLGGGGKEHADTLRSQGLNVGAISFGDGVSLPPKHGLRLVDERFEAFEESRIYLNRRAQMYGEASDIFNPVGEHGGFALPFEGEQYQELRRQLAPLPKLYDAEGRLYMLPKDKRRPDSKEQTLIELLGCSPDEADALVLGIHRMLHEEYTAEAG